MNKGRVEIERKWLVNSPPKLSKRKGVKIIQGYIAVSSDGTEVRLRRKGGRFFETAKTGEGLRRGEIEIGLSARNFKKLWPATQGRRIEKLRYPVKWRGWTIELDVYKKELAGLTIAEVEFKSRREAARFSPPSWFRREVTEAVIAVRHLVLEAAYRKHPERFVRRPPEPQRLPAAVWINPPTKVIQNSSCGPSAEKTSHLFDSQAICLTAPDALDGPESHATGEIQPVATLNSIVQLSQNR